MSLSLDTIANGEASRVSRLLASQPELEVSLEAAAVLLSLAMRDTHNPVSDIAHALSRMSERMNADAKAGDTRLRDRIGPDLACCLQGLQFHDRLMQQLVAVRSFLAGLVDQSSFEADGFGAKRWEELLRVLRERLSTDTQHHLFRSLMRNELHGGDPRTEDLGEGSVELF